MPSRWMKIPPVIRSTPSSTYVPRNVLCHCYPCLQNLQFPLYRGRNRSRHVRDERLADYTSGLEASRALSPIQSSHRASRRLVPRTSPTGESCSAGLARTANDLRDECADIRHQRHWRRPSVQEASKVDESTDYTHSPPDLWVASHLPARFRLQTTPLLDGGSGCLTAKPNI
jgi:hypothetical protein